MPLVQALAVAQLAVGDGERGTEFALEALHHLRCERDFRDQEDNSLALLQAGTDQRDVNLCLAAAGNAVKQINPEFRSLPRYLLHRELLLCI